MPSRIRRHRLAAAALLAAIALGGCTSAVEEPTGETGVVTERPAEGTTVIADADAASRAIATSRLLVESSPVVVVAGAGDGDATLLAAQVAMGLGVPLLLDASDEEEAGDAGTTAAPTAAGTRSALSDEIGRLGSRTVIAVGAVDAESFPGHDVVPSDATPEALREATGVDVSGAPESRSLASIAELAVPARSAVTATDAPVDPMPEPAEPLDGTVALSTDEVGDAAALATARAAGVPVTVLPDDAADPLGSSTAIAALGDAGAGATLLLGAAFGALPDPDYAVRAAASGAELPGGGQHVFGDRLFVALYGAPGAPILGVLGEQDVPATIERARQTAAQYDGLTDRTVVPTLEVIASVAAGAAGADGNFSNELPIDRLEPYIDAAADAGMYVVLDLQPGRADFLTQAKLYETLLAKPNVGLALDPEWRLGPNETHLTQIGSVSADEINSVSDWLADLVNRESLPPKMLVLHQFRLDMIENRQDVDMSHPELELLIHADGQGSQPDKQATWRALHGGAPEGMAWGWKNFYDEDAPMLSPEQTMTEVTPEVDLVTYQ